MFAPQGRAAVARRAHNLKVAGSNPVFATGHTPKSGQTRIAVAEIQPFKKTLIEITL
jgi:hypothetical protein